MESKLELKKSLNVKVLLIFIFVMITMFLTRGSYFIYESEELKYKEEIYQKKNQEVIEKYNFVFTENQKNNILIATSLFQNNDVKSFLLKKKDLNIKNIIKKYNKNNPLKRIDIEILDEKGHILKSTYSKENYISLITIEDISLLNNFPRNISGVEIAKDGLFFINRFPIFEKEKLIGFFNIRFDFNYIINTFNENGFLASAIVNPKSSSKMEINHTNLNIYNNNLYKIYLENHFTIHSNTSRYLMKRIEDKSIDFFYKNWEDNLIKLDNDLFFKIDILNNKNELLGKLIILENINDIPLTNLESIQKQHILLTIILVLVLGLVLIYVFQLKNNLILQHNLKEYILRNEELEVKSLELDYKDKKIENLFQNQPNIMFMHNSKYITEANKRFLGLLKLSKFEDFRENHKCVSELFLPSENKDYITSNKINDIYWLDYILANPKKMYKAKILNPNNNKEHHFLIKLNNMKFTSVINEKLIIVALVDITQIITSKKENDKILKKLQSKEKNIDLEIQKAMKEKDELLENTIKEKDKEMSDLKNNIAKEIQKIREGK